MASLNSCSFTGNLTRDAEVNEKKGTEVASFAIAVNGRKGKDGKPEVLYLNCDLWRPGGVGEYLTRGKQVAVSGELRCNKYEKDGQKREFWVLEVRNLALLGGGKTRESESEEPESEEAFATPF